MSGTPSRTLADLKDLAVTSAAAQEMAPKYEVKRDAQGRSYATGRRKNAIARVWIKPGRGEITVNGRGRA
jgi:small subunit ribosomal protein S9